MSCLQRMQLTSISSASSLCILTIWQDSWTIELNSFQTICWIFLIDVCLKKKHHQVFAFKGCSWRPIPAYPQFSYRQCDKLVELASFRAFEWYAEPYKLTMVLDPLILIECPAFKGCSWRAIPAHPQCALAIWQDSWTREL